MVKLVRLLPSMSLPSPRSSKSRACLLGESLTSSWRPFRRASWRSRRLLKKAAEMTVKMKMRRMMTWIAPRKRWAARRRSGAIRKEARLAAKLLKMNSGAIRNNLTKKAKRKAMKIKTRLMTPLAMIRTPMTVMMTAIRMMAPPAAATMIRMPKMTSERNPRRKKTTTTTTIMSTTAPTKTKKTTTTTRSWRTKTMARRAQKTSCRTTMKSTPTR